MYVCMNVRINVQYVGVCMCIPICVSIYVIYVCGVYVHAYMCIFLMHVPMYSCMHICISVCLPFSNFIIVLYRIQLWYALLCCVL
jgi:hypothetical protein